MNRGRVITALAFLCASIAFLAGEAMAQQKQRFAYTTSPENIKITQQYVIEVGDVPGHQVRLFEQHRTYPNNPPMIDGLRLVESWHRGITDYTDRNGPGTVYVVYVFENGDKFFCLEHVLSQNIGTGNVTAVAGPITGGTGKFVGIRGTTRLFNTPALNSNVNQSKTEFEYWIDR